MKIIEEPEEEAENGDEEDQNADQPRKRKRRASEDAPDNHNEAVDVKPGIQGREKKRISYLESEVRELRSRLKRLSGEGAAREQAIDLTGD